MPEVLPKSPKSPYPIRITPSFRPAFKAPETCFPLDCILNFSFGRRISLQHHADRTTIRRGCRSVAVIRRTRGLSEPSTRFVSITQLN